MKKFIIKEELLQGVASYLATKPYQEVRGIFEALGKLQEFKEEEPKTEKKEDKEIKK